MINKLIVLEGLDGAGKSTQIEKVKKYFELNSLKYEYFHFPMYGHNEFSEIIAKFLRGEFGGINDVDPYFVANIYAMDRFMFLPELNKAIKENDVILLDRYVFSNMAFQCAKYKFDGEALEIREWINKFEFVFLNLPYPDLTIFLNVPINIIDERLKEKRIGDDRKYLEGKKDIHEADLNYQKKVRDNYLYLRNYANYKIIPCAKKIEETWDIFTPDDLFESYKKYLDYIFIKTI